MEEYALESPVRGLVQDRPLLISSIIEYAARTHGRTEVVTRMPSGEMHFSNYSALAARCRKLAQALFGLGVNPGDAVATLAWNTFRHLELHYGISGIGAIYHSVNPRLHPDQLVYIMEHAQDRVLFVDPDLVPLAESLSSRLPFIEAYVILGTADEVARTSLANAVSYEDFIAPCPERFEWPTFDENTASSLFYTSGTTGNPKGVMYSHRSNVLQAMMVCGANLLGLSARDVVMPLTPMFHANASWTASYSAPMSGAKLVFPGNRYDGQSLYTLIHNEQVTFTLGVPTVMAELLSHLRATGRTVPTLDRLAVGGSAAPPSMIEAFERDYQVRVIHGWGMTELGPWGSTGALKFDASHLTASEQLKKQTKQGWAFYGIEHKIVDEGGLEVSRDGKTHGRLMARGLCVLSGYYKRPDLTPVDEDGWLDTGDIATLDDDGLIQITDRAKDVIKSGGEWISSIDIENEVGKHPAVMRAAVIGVKHPRWEERPLLIVSLNSGQAAAREELLEFLRPRIAKWWLPDDIVFVESIPLNATGKIDKLKIREQFRDHPLPEAP